MGQGKQVPAPGEGPKSPGAQGAQEIEKVVPRLGFDTYLYPAGHAVHRLVPELQNIPPEHAPPQGGGGGDGGE